MDQSGRSAFSIPWAAKVEKIQENFERGLTLWVKAPEDRTQVRVFM
jgi:hypothetical protein